MESKLMTSLGVASVTRRSGVRRPALTPTCSLPVHGPQGKPICKSCKMLNRARTGCEGLFPNRLGEFYIRSIFRVALDALESRSIRCETSLARKGSAMESGKEKQAFQELAVRNKRLFQMLI